MAYDAEKFDLGSSRDRAPTTCAATRDPIARAAPVDPLTITDPKERLRYLADFLRGLDPARFDMSWWAADPVDGDAVTRKRFLSDCGTVGCIGGWTMALFQNANNMHGCDGRAGALLGLSNESAKLLFYPREVYSLIGPGEAAVVIDTYLSTGKVEWNLARSEA